MYYKCVHKTKANYALAQASSKRS